jgi:hypothetical protein
VKVTWPKAVVIAEYRSGVNRGGRKAVVLDHENESNKKTAFSLAEI